MRPSTVTPPNDLQFFRRPRYAGVDAVVHRGQINARRELVAANIAPTEKFQSALNTGLARCHEGDKRALGE